MNQNELAARVRRVIKDIAPEADVDHLNPRHSFRDQLDMDSIDYLNFILALEADIGVRIPDADYPKLSSLAGCIDYLSKTARQHTSCRRPGELGVRYRRGVPIRRRNRTTNGLIPRADAPDA